MEDNKRFLLLKKIINIIIINIIIIWILFSFE